MTENTSPTFSKKCEILADLWINYKADEQFQDFVEYNDLGLPLAYCIANGIALPTKLAEKYIDETYDVLVEALGASTDREYESLEDMLGEFPTIE
jgi:hypothetical protein